MTILRSYLVFSILRGVATVLTVLVLVLSSVQFVQQLYDVGTADYGLADAAVYVILSVPRTIFQTLPVAALVGTLLSLGNLAVHHELVVMRASGITKWQFVATVALAGVALTVLMALLGESIAPSLGAYAREMRARALLEDVDNADGQSTWLKDGNRIINFRRDSGDIGIGSGVKVFEIGADQSLALIAQADSADVGPDDRWLLANYAETTFEDGAMHAERRSEAALDYQLSRDLLDLSVVREDYLGMPGLRVYIKYLLTNQLDADRYLKAYWGRAADVASAFFMTLLGLPFVFGGLRSAGTGARLLVGLVIGLSFIVLDEVLANSSEVFGIDPVVASVAPTAVLALVTCLAILRFR